jgi:hypothetical protein
LHDLGGDCQDRPMINKALIVLSLLTAAFATQQSGTAFLDVDDSLAGC